MRVTVVLLSLVVGAGACGVARGDQSDGLSVHWDKRFLEVRGAKIPGGPIRTHYLEAYCRSGSTNRDWSQTVIPHRSPLRGMNRAVGDIQ